MVTNLERPREVGRPRVFSDDAIFRATGLTLSQMGYGRLTLDAIAHELGCTRQALVRRFGSKHGLVRAYLVWFVDQTAAKYKRIRVEHASPMDGLRTRFLLPAEERPGEIAEPAEQANILSFFIGARDDPEFRNILAQLNMVYHDEIAQFLVDAQQAGELKPCDSNELAHLLIVATTGEVVLWSANPEGAVVDRLARAFDAVIEPYLTSGNKRIH